MKRASMTDIRHKRVDNHSFMQEIRRMFNEEGRKSVTFVVRGASMNPFLASGRDKVILAPPRSPKIGDVVLAEFKERVYALHRVIDFKDGTYTMRGDGNPLSMTELFTEEKIVGIAEAFIRKGKRIDTTSTKWRLYSSTWKTLSPFRRVLLAIYRRIIVKILP